MQHDDSALNSSSAQSLNDSKPSPKYIHNLTSRPTNTFQTNECNGESSDEDTEDGYGPTVAIQRSEWELFKRQCRTTQLVFANQHGRMVTHLRQPRNLYAISADCLSQVTARWPSERFVVSGGRPLHLEYIPSKPEPFLRQELGPEISNPLAYHLTTCNTGKLVYDNTPDPDAKFFVHSRVGGKTVSPAPWYTLNGPKDTTLQFESRFESGNLMKAVQVNNFDYQLSLQFDLYTKKYTQWFYFKISNVKAGVKYRFTIMNLLKRNSLYNQGMQPLLYSEHKALHQQIGWHRAGKDINYYKNNIKYEDNGKERHYYSVTWTCQFDVTGDVCYFAHSYPYTYSDLQLYLTGIATDSKRSQFCKQRVLCQTLAGNHVYILTITSQEKRRIISENKRVVVVTARVHPGETVSSWMMKGLIDFLTSNHADAKILRKCFVFKLLPMINPDGVVVGNYRCSLAGRDLNRNYKTILKDAFPPAYHARALIKRLQQEREVLLYCDLHGHSRRQNVFIYGCENKDKSYSANQQKVFPFMMAKNTPNKFSYSSCRFSLKKNKEGTGRVVMWRLGIHNSYTMEASFCGSSIGQLSGYQFSIADYELIGYHFCDTLMDYCDPDPAKYMYIMSMLKEQAEKIKEKGNDNEDNLSTSSGTEGSDSSVSDGLPMQLLHATIPQISQRKRLRSKRERDRRRSKDLQVENGLLMSPTNEGDVSNVSPKMHLTKRKKRLIGKIMTNYTTKGDNGKKVRTSSPKNLIERLEDHSHESRHNRCVDATDYDDTIKSSTKEPSSTRYNAAMNTLYGRRTTCEKCHGRKPSIENTFVSNVPSSIISSTQFMKSANQCDSDAWRSLPLSIGKTISHQRPIVTKAIPISPTHKFMTARKRLKDAASKKKQTLDQKDNIDYLRKQLAQLLRQSNNTYSDNEEHVQAENEKSESDCNRVIQSGKNQDNFNKYERTLHYPSRRMPNENYVPEENTVNATDNYNAEDRILRKEMISHNQPFYNVEDQTVTMIDKDTTTQLAVDNNFHQIQSGRNISPLLNRERYLCNANGSQRLQDFQQLTKSPKRSVSDTATFQRSMSPLENIKEGYYSLPELTNHQNALSYAVYDSSNNISVKEHVPNIENNEVISTLPLRRDAFNRRTPNESASMASYFYRTATSDMIDKRNNDQMNLQGQSSAVLSTDRISTQKLEEIQRRLDLLDQRMSISQNNRRVSPSGVIDGRYMSAPTYRQSQQLLSIQPKATLNRSETRRCSR